MELTPLSLSRRRPLKWSAMIEYLPSSEGALCNPIHSSTNPALPGSVIPLFAPLMAPDSGPSVSDFVRSVSDKWTGRVSGHIDKSLILLHCLNDSWDFKF